jgi:hypothetical protein
MPKFSDALNRTADDIKRPANLPIGNYIFTVKSVEQGEMSSAKGSWETLDFLLVVQSPCDDVDPDEIEAFGANIDGQMIRKRIMFSNDEAESRGFELSMNDLKRFLEHCQVGFTAGGEMTVGEAIANLPGAQVQGQVTHRADKNNPENLYPEVRQTAPAP